MREGGKTPNWSSFCVPSQRTRLAIVMRVVRRIEHCLGRWLSVLFGCYTHHLKDTRIYIYIDTYTRTHLITIDPIWDLQQNHMKKMKTPLLSRLWSFLHFLNNNVIYMQTHRTLISFKDTLTNSTRRHVNKNHKKVKWHV